MILAIREYICEYADRWGIETPLYPLLRSNMNYNFIESYHSITRVVFWFNEGDNHPSIVSKIMDRTLELESIKECIEFQEKLNAKLGYELFARIYGVAQIGNDNVVFEEGIKGSTYGMELKRAVYNPERSLAHFGRVIDRQFNEMGKLFRDLQEVGNPVLADLVCPNIFPGPRLVDNITPDIKRLNQLPGIINVFRFLVTYFYSPPVRDVFKNWVEALAIAVTDKEEKTVIGFPVRRMLRQIGLDPDKPKAIWELITKATLFEMEDKIMSRGAQEEHRQWREQLVKIGKQIGRGLDPKPVIQAQERLQNQELLITPNRLKRAILNLFPSSAHSSLIKIYGIGVKKIRG